MSTKATSNDQDMFPGRMPGAFANVDDEVMVITRARRARVSPIYLDPETRTGWRRIHIETEGRSYRIDVHDDMCGLHLSGLGSQKPEVVIE